MIKLAQLLDKKTIEGLNSAGTSATDVSAGVKTVIFTVLEYYLLPTAFFLVIAYGVYGGILYMTAYGNEEKATKGKNTITWAIIGVIVIALAFVIVRYFGIVLLNASPSTIINPLTK